MLTKKFSKGVRKAEKNWADKSNIIIKGEGMIDLSWWIVQEKFPWSDITVPYTLRYKKMK